MIGVYPCPKPSCPTSMQQKQREQSSARESGSYAHGILLKLFSVVIQEHSALAEKSFAIPVIHSKEFKCPAARNSSRRIRSNNQPLDYAPFPGLRVVRQDLRYRFRYLHVHDIILSRDRIPARRKPTCRGPAAGLAGAVCQQGHACQWGVYPANWLP